MAKVWFGKTLHPAILAFKGATLLTKSNRGVYTSWTSHPIRKLFGFAIGRTIITIARCDKPRFDRVFPEDHRA